MACTILVWDAGISHGHLSKDERFGFQVEVFRIVNSLGWEAFEFEEVVLSIEGGEVKLGVFRRLSEVSKGSYINLR